MKIIDAMNALGVKPVKLEGLDSHVPEGTIFDEYGNTYDVAHLLTLTQGAATEEAPAEPKAKKKAKKKK